jgi:UDP-N-acetylmuramate--alanine ligase
VKQLPKDGVHIVGIGGAGMSAIARVLIAQGYRVSGSDAKDSKRLLALRQLGIETYVGHASANLASAKVVIASTAIPAANIELTVARELGIDVLSRAEALAKIVASHNVVAVAGTHGKTTTTSMLTVALQSLKLDPSFIIGSELNETGSNGHFGLAEWFLVEADESDGSFLSLNPELGIITNIEADHLDRWDSLEAIQAAFLQFATNCNRGVVLCLDDPGAAALLPELKARGIPVVTYGFSTQADLQLAQLKVNAGMWQADLKWHEEALPKLVLSVPGQHNLLNAAAVAAATLVMELDIVKIVSGLKIFTGTRRRFEFRGSGNSVSVYDDYAHHPTEVAATLKAARIVAGAGQVVVVFQPFRYYRVNLFLTEFATALALADKVAVMETYAPGEAAIPGAGGAAVAAAIELTPDSVIFEPSFINVVDVIVNWAKPGDIVLTLGAGDMAMLAPQLVDALKRNVNG